MSSVLLLVSRCPGLVSREVPMMARMVGAVEKKLVV